MIALNELIQNKELFEQRYELKGKKRNLKKIFLLESIRKDLQLKTEAMRANCNKMCGSFAAARNKNEDVSALAADIMKLDKAILKNNRVLTRQNNKINQLLEKLHNLPDAENLTNLHIDTTANASSLDDLDNFLKTISKTTQSDTSINKYLASLENVILDNLPQTTKCKDGYLILSELSNFDKLKDEILNYFKSHSEHIIQVSIKKIHKECAASFIIHLNKTVSLYFDIVREFNTRHHKIKYHDKASDMTKFVNQINIKFR